MPKLNQEQLLEIFDALKKELKPYEKGVIKARMDIQGRYELWCEKKGMQAYGRTRDEVAFAAIIVQSGYVGLHYMPIYGDTTGNLRKVFPQRLLSMLKGKACFHVKEVDAGLLKEVKQVMKLGYDGYKKNGWV